MTAASLMLRIIALVVFFAAAVIVYGWFGVHDGPEPGGLIALGLAGWVLADLLDGPRPRYFKR